MITAIESGSAITWGDVLIILAIIALVIIIFGGWGRWRR